jgi:hypothetical protein
VSPPFGSVKKRGSASPETAHGPRQHIAGSQRSNLDILDGQELADAVEPCRAESRSLLRVRTQLRVHLRQQLLLRCSSEDARTSIRLQAQAAVRRSAVGLASNGLLCQTSFSQKAAIENGRRNGEGT